MKIRWMPLAEQDLEAAYEYVRQDNPKAASRLVARIFKAVECGRSSYRFPPSVHTTPVPGGGEGKAVAAATAVQSAPRIFLLGGPPQRKMAFAGGHDRR